MMLLGLFALAVVGSASATPMKTSTPAFTTVVKTEFTTAQAQAADNPWPSLASMAGKPSGPLLAHDDGYWRDGRWHDRRDDWRRDDWRRDQWRREQAYREAERRREWERREDRAMQHRYEDDHRYYRR